MLCILNSFNSPNSPKRWGLWVIHFTDEVPKRLSPGVQGDSAGKRQSLKSNLDYLALDGGWIPNHYATLPCH